MREYFSQNHFIESVISKEIVTHWIEELVKYTLELLGFRSVDLKKKEFGGVNQLKEHFPPLRQ